MDNQNKRIMIIGSTAYKAKMEEHAAKMKELGHDVIIPALDDHPEFNELGICAYNQAHMATADEVHLIWDGRSMGTIFDLGMCFGMGKPLRIIYINPKTFLNLVDQYGRLTDYLESLGENEEPEVEKMELFGKTDVEPTND